MNHDEHWKKVMNHAENTLCGLFEGCRTRVRDIVGDDNGIDAAHKVPVAELGIEVDATDAARFFDGL